MNNQIYELTQGNPQNQPIMYQPYNSDQNNQIYSQQIYQNTPQVLNYQNNPTDQYFVKPQEVNPGQNNYILNNRQIDPNYPNNQYFVLPQVESTKFIKDNKLTIPFKNNIFLFIYLFITSAVVVIFAPSFHKIYTSIILLIEILIFAYYENYKLEISKDESQMRINIKLINLLCRVTKKYDFDFDNINCNVQLIGKKYVLMVIKNFRKGNEIDLNTSDIKNKPANFFYYFENINVQKFNGEYNLNNLLNNFLGLSHQENLSCFNIYAYMNMNRAQGYFNQNNLIVNNNIKYLRINDHFFTYFNNNPLKNQKFQNCLLKVISIIIHFYLFIIYLNIGLTLNDKKDESILDFIFFPLLAFYVQIYLLGFCICKCIKKSDKYKVIRIDIIYSNDFDRMFIGVSKSTEQIYINKSEFKLDDVDRFILQKYNDKDNGFDLKAFFKGNKMGYDICFIKDIQNELEGLVYILNEKLVNNNQQRFSECAAPPTLS